MGLSTEEIERMEAEEAAKVETPPSPTRETIEDFATGAVYNAPLLGMGKAAYAGVTGDKPFMEGYGQNLEQQKQEYAAAQQRSPIATGVGSLTGNVAGMALPFGAASKIPSAAGRVIAGTGIGAVEQGLTAQGQAEPETILTSAATGGTVAGLQPLAKGAIDLGKGAMRVAKERFTKTTPEIAAESTIAKETAAQPFKEGFETFKQGIRREDLGAKQKAANELLKAKTDAQKKIALEKMLRNIEQGKTLATHKGGIAKEATTFKTNEGVRGYGEKLDLKNAKTPVKEPKNYYASESAMLNPELTDVASKVRAAGGGIYERNVEGIVNKLDDNAMTEIVNTPIKLSSTLGVSPNTQAIISDMENIRRSGDAASLLANRKQLNQVYSDPNIPKADKNVLLDYMNKVDDVIGNVAPDYKQAIGSWTNFADIKPIGMKSTQAGLRGIDPKLQALEESLQKSYPSLDPETKRILDNYFTLSTNLPRGK